jgi:septum formation inhibitor MinC
MQQEKHEQSTCIEALEAKCTEKESNESSLSSLLSDRSGMLERMHQKLDLKTEDLSVANEKIRQLVTDLQCAQAEEQNAKEVSEAFSHELSQAQLQVESLQNEVRDFKRGGPDRDHHVCECMVRSGATAADGPHMRLRSSGPTISEGCHG